MRSYFTAFFILVLLSGSFVAEGQGFSPYSRFGLGYLPSDVFPSLRGMGGISSAYNSPYHLNPSNPASYADIGLTIFEVGANADAATVKTANGSYDGVNGTISNVAMGLPLIRGKWGMSFGLLPKSFVNYDFANTEVDTSKVYTGKGSLYEVYIGTAYKIKGFSLGFNAGYSFGRLDYTKGFAFTDSINAYNVNNVSSLRVGGFVYNVGLQYKTRVLKKSASASRKQDIFVSAGVQGSTNVKLNTRVSSIWQRSIGSTVPQIIDTPLSYADQVGKMVIPYNFSMGLMLGNENWWQVGIDFKYAGWSKFTYDLNDHGLADSWRIMAGGSIVPNYDAKKKFFAHIQYKLGAYYGKSEVVYQGIQLSEYGGTVGLSVPIPSPAIFREAAKFHFSADIGTRTPGVNTLISENYYRFYFGFTLSNVWFNKRKFD